MINEEIRAALDELRRAQENFDNAEPEFVDVAIYELMAKMKKIDTLMRKARECA
ncbi:hypothetical protein [Biomaibacter acetigenes]|uniref:hypothetical protein n=1 Tax=Biomaibacter acetigenes TaxID=2316383 RepID=UPI0013CEC7D8|nr:hypothetical protein [Biomaibacter acetigenes]